MSPGTQRLVFMLVIGLLTTNAQNSQARVTLENRVKSKAYLTPKIPQHQGSVSNKTYYDIEFPKGHIAIKSFNAEFVDEEGNPISLQETYLHHWAVTKYFQKRNGIKDLVISRNAGVCNRGLSQFFGLGSETRKTSARVPDPYGIEVGNPGEVPAGYEEKWMLNVHAIDTRGAVDAMGCAQCRCNLYNVTEDKDGQPLKPNYVGGFYCCYDGTQCKVKNGIQSEKRNVYMKYTIEWVDWSDSVIPVKIYIFDVTDSWQQTRTHDCLLEFDVKQCATGVATKDCTTNRRSNTSISTGGDVVYGVAHLHNGGIGSVLYGEDGRVICSSKAIYGEGNEAGNESGYLVGMTACYPKPGSVKIGKDEILTVESKYSSQKSHTGVTGFFYVLVAEYSKTF